MSSLPADWAWRTMAEVAEVKAGSTPKTAEPSYWGGDIPWITPKDLAGHNEKYVARGARNITTAGLESCSAQLLPPGTVLFSTRAPIGYVAIAANPVTTNQGFKNFVPGQDVSSDYLYWYLRASKALATSLSSGTTFAELSGKAAAKMPIPVPPREIQDAIVEEIEKQFTRLDAGVTGMGIARIRLSRFRAAVLEAAVSGSMFSDAEFADGVVSDFADVQLGRQRSPKNHQGPNMKPYLRAANVTWDGLELSDVKDMNFSPAEAERFRLLPGDILIAEASGSQFEVGKAAIWGGEISDCCFQNTLLRVRSRDVLPEYLLLVFQHAASTGAFGRAARGVGIHHLGAKALSEWPVRVPKKSIQGKIVEATQDRLVEIRRVQDGIRAEERRARSLGGTILAKAFSGELITIASEGALV